ERADEAIAAALASCHERLQRVSREYGGHLLRESGDAVIAAFPRAGDALRGAIAGQQALQDFGFWILDFGLPAGGISEADGRPPDCSGGSWRPECGWSTWACIACAGKRPERGGRRPSGSSRSNIRGWHSRRFLP